MQKIQQHKTFFVFEGIILIILGMLAISWPTVSTLAIEKLIGWIFIIGGIAQGVRLFRAKGAPHPVSSIILAIIYLLLGITFLAYPLSGAVTITLLLLIVFIIQGVAQIVTGYKWSPKPLGGWMIFSGFVSVLLGILIWSGWPSNAAWVIGLLVGINLIVFGAFQIMLVIGSLPRKPM